MKVEKIRRYAHKIIEDGRAENDFIEYKKSSYFKDKILKTACAYANNYMERELGLIFVGVEEENDRISGDKAVPLRPISGIAEKKLESTENALRSLLSNIKPNISYQIVQDRIDDKDYLIIAVDPGAKGPYMTSDKAESDKDIRLKPGRYIRISRDTILPTPVQEYDLLKKFANYSFSSDYNDSAEKDDIDFSLVREYLQKTGAADDIFSLSDDELLKSLGLGGTSGIGGSRIKNFAVLMFTARPADYIPGAYTSVIWEAGAGTDIMSQKIFDGPVWKQSEEALSYIRTNFLRSYTVRRSGKKEHSEVFNWPFEAVKETIRNAVIHKEYAVNEYVGIYVYHDRITVINHNRPMPPVTIADLNSKTSFDDRRYINPELKTMFHNLHLIETFGSGIRRAKNAMKKNGSPEMFFEPSNERDDYTMAILPVNSEYNGLSRESGDEEPLQGKGRISFSAIKPGSGEDRIISALRNNSKLTISEIAEMTGLSIPGVNYSIRRLKDKGILERRGSKVNGEWVII